MASTKAIACYALDRFRKRKIFPSLSLQARNRKMVAKERNAVIILGNVQKKELIRSDMTLRFPVELGQQSC